MMFRIDEVSGDITLTQGDTGQYPVEGIPTDKDYRVYLAVQNNKRKQVGAQIYTNSNYSDFVTLKIADTLTDLLTVKTTEETAEYYFGIKICDDEGNEDTLIIGDKEEGEFNIITVYPKKVEGD